MQLRKNWGRSRKGSPRLGRRQGQEGQSRKRTDGGLVALQRRDVGRLPWTQETEAAHEMTGKARGLPPSPEQHRFKWKCFKGLGGPRRSFFLSFLSFFAFYGGTISSPAIKRDKSLNKLLWKLKKKTKPKTPQTIQSGMCVENGHWGTQSHTYLQCGGVGTLKNFFMVKFLIQRFVALDM